MGDICFLTKYCSMTFSFYSRMIFVSFTTLPVIQGAFGLH